MSGNSVALAAVIMSMLIPICGIIFGCLVAIRQKKSDAEIRRTLIENHTDLETTQAILAEREKKSDKYASLRGAFVLIGVGLGALADYLLDINGLFFWFVIAFGVGLGLLASFFIEQNLRDKEAKKE